MEIIPELSKERLFRTRPRQEESIVGQVFQCAKEPEPLDKLAYERIYWDEPFGFEFSEWHMNSPLVRSSRTKAV